MDRRDWSDVQDASSVPTLGCGGTSGWIEWLYGCRRDLSLRDRHSGSFQKHGH